MRMLRVAIVVLVCLPLVPSAPAAGARPWEEVQAVLDLRAKALAARDKQAFLATIDKESPDFFQRQTRWFDGVMALPAKDFRYRLDLIESPDLTRQKDRQRHGGAPVMVRAVEQRYRLEGFDLEPAVSDRVFTFVRKQGTWLITSDSDLEDLGIVVERDLWEFGPIQVQHSEHFMAVVHPDKASLADALLVSAEAALAQVGPVWKRGWHKKVPLLVPSTQDELVEMFGDTFDVSNFVAFASSALDRDGASGWDLTGTRVVVNPPNFFRGPGGRRQDVLAHELVHVATREASGPFMPIFVEEGLAQLVQDRSLGVLNSRIRAGRFDKRLPEDHEFLTGGGAEIFNSYLESLSALAYMTDRFGIDKVNEFYTNLGSIRIEPGTPRYHLEGAVARTFGITLAEFESGWASHAVQQAR